MRSELAWPFRLTALAALLAPAAAPAAAAAADGPSLADTMADYFPERAQRFEVNGKAYLECRKGADDQLADCRVLHEWPQGFGFGQASLKLVAQRFKVKAGSPGARVTVPIAWTLQKDTTAYVTFASTSSSGAPQGKNVTWAAQPSPEQIQAAYPPGRSEVWPSSTSCSVGVGGVLSGCIADTKVRTDPDFDRASATLARLFKLPADDPSLVGGKVYLPVTFIPPDRTAYGRH